MYLRRCYRRKDGKRHSYWALVESYRTARGPRQRVVAYLGELDEQGRLGVQRVAQPDPAPQSALFGEEESSREWVEVDLGGVRVERSRPFGGGWLGLMLLRQLGLRELLEVLMPSGREEIPWSAMTVVLGRLLDPSSELHLAEHGYETSALAELLGVPAAKVNDDRLYRALDRLFPRSPNPHCVQHHRCRKELPFPVPCLGSHEPRSFAVALAVAIPGRGCCSFLLTPSSWYPRK